MDELIHNSLVWQLTRSSQQDWSYLHIKQKFLDHNWNLKMTVKLTRIRFALKFWSSLWDDDIGLHCSEEGGRVTCDCDVTDEWSSQPISWLLQAEKINLSQHYNKKPDPGAWRDWLIAVLSPFASLSIWILKSCQDYPCADIRYKLASVDLEIVIITASVSNWLIMPHIASWHST